MVNDYINLGKLNKSVRKDIDRSGHLIDQNVLWFTFLHLKTDPNLR